MMSGLQCACTLDIQGLLDLSLTFELRLTAQNRYTDVSYRKDIHRVSLGENSVYSAI